MSEAKKSGEPAVLINRRTSKRQRCSHRATLSVEGIFLCHAVIKDISSIGMRLYAPQSAWLPAEFQIEAAIFDEPARVRKTWSNREHIGANFIISAK